MTYEDIVEAEAALFEQLVKEAEEENGDSNNEETR